MRPIGLRQKAVIAGFAMLASFVGTWLPFALIFASTYLTGAVVEKK